QFVKSGEGAGDFERGEHAAVEAREEGRPVARVARIEEDGLVVDRPAARVALPAGSPGSVRFDAEDAPEFRAGRGELGSHFVQAQAVDVILPAIMVVAV